MKKFLKYLNISVKAILNIAVGTLLECVFPGLGLCLENHELEKGTYEEKKVYSVINAIFAIMFVFITIGLICGIFYTWIKAFSSIGILALIFPGLVAASIVVNRLFQPKEDIDFSAKTNSKQFFYIFGFIILPALLFFSGIIIPFLCFLHV